MPSVDTLILVMGDQPSESIPALREADPLLSRVLMCELAEETRYVAHPRHKIAFVRNPTVEAGMHIPRNHCPRPSS